MDVRWGPALVAVGVGLALFGFHNGHLALEHLGAIIMFIGAMLTVVGLPTARAFFPAVVALLFLIPVPGMVRQQVAIPLQNMTAVITSAGLGSVRGPGLS